MNSTTISKPKPHLGQLVTLTGSTRAYSQFVRDRLSQVDTKRGVIVAVYPNPEVVNVTFPGINGASPLEVYLPVADLKLGAS